MKAKVYLTFLFAAAFILQSCTAINTPPSTTSVKQTFLSNYDDVMIITEYIVKSGYIDVHINDTSGTIWADFEEVHISDESVIGAIGNVLRAYKSIQKDGLTIRLLQWTGVRDIGCGVCYSLVPSVLPEIQYPVEMVRITESGWYYYVEDYEEWRVRETVYRSEKIE